jgi:branched-chain amino acid transport system permease protein
MSNVEQQRVSASAPGANAVAAPRRASAETRRARGLRMPAPWYNLPPWLRTVLPWLIFFVLAGLFPVLDGNTSQVDTAVFAMSYAILALGLNIVVGYAGLLDLGYAAFYAIGAYAFGMIASAQFQPNARVNINIGGYSLFSMGPDIGIHANFWLFLPIVALIAALFGVILGAPTLRLRGDYLAIVTLGFGEIVPSVVRNLGPNNIFGWPDITGGQNSLSGIDQPTLGSLQFTDPGPWYYLSLAVLALIVFIASRLRNSRLGRAWVAIREDEVAASCMGINLVRTKLFAFAMGAFFSGFAGMIIGSKSGSIEPSNFSFQVSVAILCAVVLGGMGSIPGAVLGGLIVGILQFSLLDIIIGWVQQSGVAQSLDVEGLKYLIFGAILVGIMLFRREGLLPSGRRARELHPRDEQTLAEENQPLYDVTSGKPSISG